MSVSIFRRGLTALLVVAWIAFGIAVAFAVVAPLVGQPLITSWPIATNQPRIVDLPPNALGSVTARLDQGVVAFDSAHWTSALLKAADVAVTGGLCLLFLTKLRAFASDVSLGRPFTETGARRFQHLGLILFGVVAWQIVDAVLWQALLLGDPGPGRPLLVSTFAKVDAASEQIRIVPRIDVTLIFAAAFMTVIGKAIRLGAEVQRDSDEIV